MLEANSLVGTTGTTTQVELKAMSRRTSLVIL